jgi:antitoxin (DNA-binding transcriptional repressor) of toxin-antitoxin stability system
MMDSWTRLVKLGEEDSVMYAVNVDEVHGILRDLLSAALRGENVVFTQDDHEVAQLVALHTPKRHPVFGSAKGLIVIADDFDDSLPEFEEYTS